MKDLSDSIHCARAYANLTLGEWSAGQRITTEQFNARYRPEMAKAMGGRDSETAKPGTAQGGIGAGSGNAQANRGNAPTDNLGA